MVVASVLMSMGMMMLPPTTISLPFKILLFYSGRRLESGDWKRCKDILLMRAFGTGDEVK